MITMPRKLAVVPAYNEAASVGDVVRSSARTARLRHRRRGRRLHRRHRPDRRGGRRAASCGCRSTSASAAPCSPASSTRWTTATTTRCRSTATASTIPAEIDKLRPRCASAAWTWSAARASSPTTRVPRADQPPHRDPPLRVPALADRRPASQRPDLGLPAVQPPRHLRLRPRLPARLPRGRGRADGALAPAADVRGARAHVRPQRRRVVDQRLGKSAYYMVKVLLAIFVGLLRGAANRRARRRRGRCGRARDLMDTPLQIVAIAGQRRALRGAPRAGPAPAAAGALRAAVAAQRARAARPRRSGAALLEELADAVGVDYAPNALFVVAFGFVLVLLLHFSLAVSRLSDQSKVLAQRLAILEERLHRQESASTEQERDEVEDLHPASRG